jgi:hypothetical protein
MAGAGIISKFKDFKIQRFQVSKISNKPPAYNKPPLLL